VTRPRVVATIVGLAIATISALIAGGDVPGWEADLFEAINDLPDVLEAPMWVFQLAGLLLVPFGIAAVAAMLGRFRLAIAAVLVVPLKLLFEKLVVKQLVERERPGTSICELDEACANFRSDVPLEGLSFVSGHAIIAWALATILWPYLRGPWRWIPIAVATLNAIARVYLGAHNPLDVIGGAGVGLALGAALLMVVGAPVAPAKRAD
jgi:undecaprenyl-diphosphatase